MHSLYTQLTTLIPLVIHAFLSPKETISILPTLLEGNAPAKIDKHNVGTKDYSRGLAAVILGGGYDDGEVAQIRTACEGKSLVPWMRPNMSTPAPPMGPAYGAALVERIKVSMKQLKEEGKVEGDGTYLY